MSSRQPRSSLQISLDEPAAAARDTTGARPFARRRRNRHGRGLRGPLLSAELPAARTRSAAFEDLVVDSAERLRELLQGAADAVEYVVEEVPTELERLIAEGVQAPLGAHRAARPGTAASPARPATVLIFRHPVEALCDAPWQTRELVHEVLIEQLAALLGLDPDTVDPQFRRFRGH